MFDTGRIENSSDILLVSTPWRSPQEKGDGWRVLEMVSFYSPTGTGIIEAYIDRVVKLWDLHQEDLTVPSCSFNGPGVSTSCTVLATSC
jgi:hypothetical protein